MNLLSLLKNSQIKLVNYIELKKNETLFRENEECRAIGIVINGEIKIVSYSFEGREIIYSINKENTIFGNNLIFSSLPFYKGSIIAKTNCKIALISKNNFISNCLIFALILENILISPITYKLFKLPYNNYITFLKEHPDFIN